MNCKEGHSEVIKDGFVKGRQRYFCKKCDKTFRPITEEKNNNVEKLALQLYFEGLSFRRIAQLTGGEISDVTIMNWVNESAGHLKKFRKNKREIEVFTFKKHLELTEYLSKVSAKVRAGILIIGLDKNAPISCLITPSKEKDNEKDY
jgi:transposase-like protein